MKYFAVLLPMLDEEKSQEYRPQHLDFLAKLRNEWMFLVYIVEEIKNSKYLP